ncbi:MAG TPA: 2'-5' RNA ligase family protein, partial [Acidimicrobiales bacterium]|nr:2'-5' RNA ligase family protein [Acidimicrobiales bacterium]
MVSGGSSSGRRRLGVALLLDPPHAAEVDGLRRAVGDRSLGRVPPHLTLVPPVNVRGRDLTAALGRLRAAAAAGGRPLRLTLGPPTTFLPANPVLYLPVGGDLPELRRVHDTVFAGPLHRPLAWPWVPHVTLADDATPERIAAAMDALTGYQVVVDIDRLTMLEERSATFAPGERGAVRRWVPYADAALAPPAVVGRGGLEVTLVQGRVLGPDARRLIDELGELGDDGSGEGPADVEPEIVLTALAGAWGAGGSSVAGGSSAAGGSSVAGGSSGAGG